ncbi:MAG: T9SS type A sorting domain-containing protein [Candidatus Marinimicrobia bacterium]|nr:T9SS type A sorting domain-containing protein [Candidatus Neomarinimicrobiota bacterium]
MGILKNNVGKSIASGVYIYQLKMNDFSQTKKLVVHK